jgi:hypothetical protein
MNFSANMSDTSEVIFETVEFKLPIAILMSSICLKMIKKVLKLILIKVKIND